MRKSTVLLSIALAASLASAAWLLRELRAEQARTADLTLQLARRAEAGRVEIVRPVRATAEPVSAAAVPVPAAPTQHRLTDQRDAWEEHQRMLMRDPRYREALRAQKRLAYAPRRANFIRLLGMTPAQADAAIDLGLDHDARWQEESNNEARVESRDEKQARLDALDNEYQDKLRALLGESKRAQLQTYMETRGSRMQVDNLRAELTEANALRDDQVEPLIAALHDESAQMQNALEEYRNTLSWEGDTKESWQRYNERQAQLMKTRNARMLSSAASILTGPQLGALDALLKRQFASFEAQQRLTLIESKLEPPGTPGTSSN